METQEGRKKKEESEKRKIKNIYLYSFSTVSYP